KIVPIVTDIQTSTYAEQGLTEEAAAFELLNAERSRCGFGTLRQNAALDKAAKAHADWQNLNGYLDHLETPEAPNGFTGFGPSDRIVAAGYGTPGDVTDEIAGRRVAYGEVSKNGFGIAGVRSLLNAPFHMAGLVVGYRDIGLAVRTSSEVGTNYGRVLLQANLAYLHTTPRQELSDKDVLTYPCDGTTGTDYELTHESPNPVPGRDLRANPLGGSVFVLLRSGHVLTITSATIIQVNGSNVPLRMPAVAYRGLANEGYIVADAPLLPNTQYEVVINGTNNGVPFTRQFTFTTGTGG
ncbi:MAG: CAP domain-containing protein, partial [Rhodoferax sp.]|nr:CAP domain-containing protein [Rhodoferax sp.]